MHAAVEEPHTVGATALIICHLKQKIIGYGKFNYSENSSVFLKLVKI